MASITLKTTRSGAEYYEIRVRRGRNLPTMSMRWDIPRGWSKRSIQRELEKVAHDFEAKVKSGEVVSRREQAAREADAAAEQAKIMTFRRFVEEVYLPSLELRCSENSRLSYTGNLRHHVFPVIGDLKMPYITPAQLTGLLNNLRHAGLSCASTVKVYTILSGIFKYATLIDVVAVNPMIKVERPKPSKDEKVSADPPSYSAEELIYILEYLQNEPLQWQAYVNLLVDTGARRGEICGLRWSDIDFKTGILEISGSLNYSPDRGVYRSSTKNGRSRTMRVSDGVLDLLKQLRKEQSKHAISQYVFTQADSPEPMHPQSPTRFMQKFGKRYGIENLHPHKLRHSFASLAITNGADIASVAAKLGHSDPSILLRVYTHASQESVDHVSDIFRGVLESTKSEKSEKKSG